MDTLGGYSPRQRREIGMLAYVEEIKGAIGLYQTITGAEVTAW